MAAFLFSVSSVPDWGRRAIRLALALFFFTRLGHTLWLMPEYLRAEWGDELRQSCNWAGASCAVVAASPLIGKVAQLSYERTLGTIAGGLLGFLAYDYGAGNLPDELDAWFLSVASAFVGALSCWLSYKYKLDASMRLFVITFLMVTFGAQNPERGALMVALLRTSGIVAGVLTLMMLTVIILPKSATVESLREVKRSLKSLVELNRLVLESIQLRLDQGSAAQPPKPTATEPAAVAVAAANKAREAAGNGAHGGAGVTAGRSAGSPVAWPWGHKGGQRADGYQPLLEEEAMEEGQQQPVADGDAGGAAGGAFDAEKWDKYEAACEKVLTDVYQSMFKVKDQIELSRNEVYVWHFYGHYVFLPTLPGGLLSRWFTQRRWSLLASDMDSVATCIRRLARLLWTVHLDCDEAFDNEMMRQLNASCQGGLVQALSTALGTALTALADAFPNQRTIRVDGLHAFKDAVAALFALSEAQRQEVIQLMARARARAPRPQRASQASFTAVPAAPSQVSFVSSSWGGAEPQQQLSQLRALFSRSAAAAVACGRLAGGQGLGSALGVSAPATAMSAPPGVLPMPQGSVPVRSILGFKAPEQQPSGASVVSVGAAADAEIAAVLAERVLKRATSSFSEAEVAARSSLDRDSRDADHTPSTQQRSSPLSMPTAPEATPGSSPPQHPGAPITPSPFTPRPVAAAAPGAATAAGPAAAADGAPAAAAAGARGSASAAAAAAAAVGDETALDAAVANPLLFPASSHDYVSQVRWHTFQFLMDELEEELEELFLAISAVLDKLPYAV